MRNIKTRISKASSTTTIAFLGTGRGTGTTFLCMALANYLVRWESKRIAFLSLSGRYEPEALREFERGDHFSIDGVTYFPRPGDNDIPAVLNQNFDFVLFDLGCDEKHTDEFFRSSRRYLVGSLTPWRISEQERFLQNISQYNSPYFHNSVLFLSFGGNRYDKKHFAREQGMSVTSIPFIEDPFDIGKEHRAFFHALL